MLRWRGSEPGGESSPQPVGCWKKWGPQSCSLQELLSANTPKEPRESLPAASQMSPT